MPLQTARLPCPPCHAFTVKPHKLGKGETAEDVATDKGSPPPFSTATILPCSGFSSTAHVLGSNSLWTHLTARQKPLPMLMALKSIQPSHMQGMPDGQNSVGLERCLRLTMGVQQTLWCGAGISVHELLSLNHELDEEHFKDGQSILVPAVSCFC